MIQNRKPNHKIITYKERHKKDKSLKGERTMKQVKKDTKKVKKGKKGFDPKKFDKTKKQVFGMK